jgi:hypothetical protein
MNCPIKLEFKVKFYGYEGMKSNLNKENFRSCFRTRDLYSCRKKINGVESMKYSSLHFILLLDMVFNLLLPGNVVISVFIFLFLYYFHFKNCKCFSLYFSLVINNFWITFTTDASLKI